MHLSRELAIEEMAQTVKVIKKWIGELEHPSEVHNDGSVKPVYPKGVPEMLSVAEIRSIPIAQFRAELSIAAAKLEAIAST